LKSKRGEEIKDLFVELFKEANPEKVQFDEGKEFYNKYLKDLLEKNNIKRCLTYSDKKAVVVERFNIAQKEKMYMYFTAK
jgi:hypothetical protein